MAAGGGVVGGGIIGEYHVPPISGGTGGTCNTGSDSDAVGRDELLCLVDTDDRNSAGSHVLAVDLGARWHAVDQAVAAEAEDDESAIIRDMGDPRRGTTR